MAEKKITKREMFEQIKAKYELTEDEKKFIDHELELLAKKNSTEKKPTAQQEANKALKEVILDNLTEEGITITDLQKKVDELAELSNQRVSALMRQLVTDNLVIKTEDKRKSYFSLPTE
jgi:predicted transcriptional regulator